MLSPTGGIRAQIFRIEAKIRAFLAAGMRGGVVMGRNSATGSPRRSITIIPPFAASRTFPDTWNPARLRLPRRRLPRCDRTRALASEGAVFTPPPGAAPGPLPSSASHAFPFQKPDGQPFGRIIFCQAGPLSDRRAAANTRASSAAPLHRSPNKRGQPGSN